MFDMMHVLWRLAVNQPKHRKLIGRQTNQPINPVHVRVLQIYYTVLRFSAVLYGTFRTHQEYTVSNAHKPDMVRLPHLRVCCSQDAHYVNRQLQALAGLSVDTVACVTPVMSMPF